MEIPFGAELEGPVFTRTDILFFKLYIVKNYSSISDMLIALPLKVNPVGYLVTSLLEFVSLKSLLKLSDW